MLSIASYRQAEYVDGSQVFVCLTTVETAWRVFFFIGTITLFFLIPFFILLVLYSVIAKHLMNNPGIISYGHRSNVLKYRKQVIFMLAAVVVSFFVCLLPFRGLTLWIIIAPQEDLIALGVEKYYNILYFSRIMLYLNSAMNPILYNLMSSKFREGFFRLLGCRSFVARKKFIHGSHKGTFHTTSTNLSSSQSNDRRIHHQSNHNNHKSNSNGSRGSFSSSFSNRKRMSEAFGETMTTSGQLGSEYLANGSAGGGRKKNNFIIKKCLVESTVINAIAHEPAANKDLSRKLKQNLVHSDSDFVSEMEDEGVEEGLVISSSSSRRNSRNLMRRPSRHFEFTASGGNGGCRSGGGDEHGNGDVIVVLLKPATVNASSPIHEESRSNSVEEEGNTGGVEDDEIVVGQEESLQGVDEIGQEVEEAPTLPTQNRRMGEEGEDAEVDFNFEEAVFLTAKESMV